MFLKKQKRTLSFLLALILVLSTFMSVAVFPASAEGEANYLVTIPGEEDQTFTTLSAALAGTAAVQGRVITVLQNAEKSLAYNEQCTIPSGTTLLIPFDDDHTIFGDDVLSDNSKCAQTAMSTYKKPENYMTLDMQGNSSLTIENGGALYLGGKAFTSALGGESQLMPGSGLEENRQSVPSGPDGRIHMNSGSKITVDNGGKLYAFGYIYGAGTEDDIVVEANDHAEVYEYFQITGWRGKDATIAALNKNNTEENDDIVFPFNQYYIQNIEVPLKVNKGAKEIVYATLFNISSTLITFIGDGGMFQIEDNGYLIKDYIEATDRLSIESHCDATLGSLSLNMAGIDLSTTRFPYLPLTNNISITVAEGTVDVAENIALLPGTELTVAEGATVSVAEEKTVYVMSASDWNVGSAMANSEIFPVAYTTATDTDPYAGTPYEGVFEGMPMQRVSIGVNQYGPTIEGTADAIKDADVEINGTAEVYGAFLTKAPSDGTSNVHGTGEIIYCPDSDTSSVPFYNSNTGQKTDEMYDIAYIKKADGTYVQLGGTSDPNHYDMATGEATTPMYYVMWYYAGAGSDLSFQKAYDLGDTPVYTGPEAPEESGECIGWHDISKDPEMENLEKVDYLYGRSFPKVVAPDPVWGAIIYTAVFDTPSEYFKKHSLSLNGDIGVNFYVDLPAGSTADDVKMDFSWGNKYVSTDEYDPEEPYTLNDVTGAYDDEASLYKFTLPIAAKELNDTITATLKYNDGTEIETETYSGMTYAYKLLAKTDVDLTHMIDEYQDPAALNYINYGAKLRALVESMLNYCSAAQDEFKYNTDTHANDGLTDAQKNLKSVSLFDLTDDDLANLPAGLEFYGTSLNLGTKTSYDICLINRDKTELTVSAAFDDEEETAVAASVRNNDIAYVVRVENLAAAKVTDSVKLTINGATVTVNAGAYIKKVLENKNATDQLYKTVTALYGYNQSADVFFSSLRD
ncbi:MAG: hypothetical protein IJH07_08330 [Ruminococcus sp.]|nr:hypothetical protein [Ruminococcus sp.]